MLLITCNGCHVLRASNTFRFDIEWPSGHLPKAKWAFEEFRHIQKLWPDFPSTVWKWFIPRKLIFIKWINQISMEVFLVWYVNAIFFVYFVCLLKHLVNWSITVMCMIYPSIIEYQRILKSCDPLVLFYSHWRQLLKFFQYFRFQHMVTSLGIPFGIGLAYLKSLGLERVSDSLAMAITATSQNV